MKHKSFKLQGGLLEILAAPLIVFSLPLYYNYQAKLSQQIGIAARPLRTNLQNDVVVLDELFNNDASFTDSLTKVSQRRLVCDHRHTFDRG